MIGRTYVLAGLEFEVLTAEGELYGIKSSSNLELYIKKQTLTDAIKLGDAIEKNVHDESLSDPDENELTAGFLAALADPKA